MKYHNITKDDMLNGPGLRVVAWLSGCQHACPECHNQCTWDPNVGLEFDDAAKAEIFEQLEKPYIDGITFSGGDPLHPANEKEVGDLIRIIHERYPDKTIIVYTGYTVNVEKEYEISDEVIGIKMHLDNFPWELVDIIFDGRFDKEQRKIDIQNHMQKQWVGSSNQRMLVKKGNTHEEEKCFIN